MVPYKQSSTILQEFGGFERIVGFCALEFGVNYLVLPGIVNHFCHWPWKISLKYYVSAECHGNPWRNWLNSNQKTYQKEPNVEPSRNFTHERQLIFSTFLNFLVLFCSLALRNFIKVPNLFQKKMGILRVLGRFTSLLVYSDQRLNVKIRK